MYSLHLTHPKVNTHPEQWAAMLQRPGSSWGVGALLKDTSVVVLKEERALVIHSLTNRGAVRGGKVRTILRPDDGRGPPREKRDFYRGER